MFLTIYYIPSYFRLPFSDSQQASKYIEYPRICTQYLRLSEFKKKKKSQLFQNIQTSVQWKISSPETFMMVVINFLKG